MKRSMGIGWGVLLIVLGTGLLSWVSYNLFVDMQPAAEGRNPLPPILFGAAMLVVGVLRLRQALRAGTEPRRREDA